LKEKARMTTAAKLAAHAAKAGVIGALLVSVSVESIVVRAQEAATTPPPAQPAPVVSTPEAPAAATPTAPVPTESATPPMAAPAEPPPMAAEPPPPALEPPTMMPREPPPSQRPSQPPMTSKPSKLPSYILWGLGGASLIVGAVFGVSALAAKNKFNDSPSYSRADSAHNLGIDSDAALGLGIILAVTGTFFYFLEEPAPDATLQANTRSKTLTDLQVAPLVTPHAGGGAVSLRF
jgi:hypothetical protein